MQLGKDKSKDGENSMFFDMPVNKTTCHCIGPAYADGSSGDTKDNQGPLGGNEDIIQIMLLFSHCPFKLLIRIINVYLQIKTFSQISNIKI